MDTASSNPRRTLRGTLAIAAAIGWLAALLLILVYVYRTSGVEAVSL
jgi:hypothetical protein